jgi:hypothetical protein
MKLFCPKIVLPKSSPHRFRVLRDSKPRPRHSPRLQGITRHGIRPLSSDFRRLATVLCLLLAVSLASLAAGFSKSYSLSTGTVTVTNNQKRSSWHPVALLFHFTASADPTISVKRLSKGTEYLLSSVTLTNVQDVTWIPDADYPFNFGDALIISTTATDGTLEIIQRSD